MKAIAEVIKAIARLVNSVVRPNSGGGPGPVRPPPTEEK